MLYLPGARAAAIRPKRALLLLLPHRHPRTAATARAPLGDATRGDYYTHYDHTALTLLTMTARGGPSHSTSVVVVRAAAGGSAHYGSPNYASTSSTRYGSTDDDGPRDRHELQAALIRWLTHSLPADVALGRG